MTPVELLVIGLLCIFILLATSILAFVLKIYLIGKGANGTLRKLTESPEARLARNAAYAITSPVTKKVARKARDLFKK